jgi:hypothetical protein
MEENKFTAILPQLQKFGYHATCDGNELIIKPNKLSYLKVKYNDNKYSFSNWLTFGLRFTTLEYNFLFYAVFFAFAEEFVKYKEVMIVVSIGFLLGLILLYTNLLLTKHQIIRWLEESNS